jgi:hypothetical protein
MSRYRNCQQKKQRRRDKARAKAEAARDLEDKAANSAQDFEVVAVTPVNFIAVDFIAADRNDEQAALDPSIVRREDHTRSSKDDHAPATFQVRRPSADYHPTYRAKSEQSNRLPAAPDNTVKCKIMKNEQMFLAAGSRSYNPDVDLKPSIPTEVFLLYPNTNSELINYYK